MEQEKAFMVEVERDEAEVMLRNKSPGAFLIRPKNEVSLVISVLLSHDAVDHLLVHRIGSCYQSDAIGASPLTTIHEFLSGLQISLKLPNLVFYKDAVEASDSTKPTKTRSEVG